MKLGKHFDSSEFKCHDGTEHPIDPALIAMLDEIRDYFGPVEIVSGYRSPDWNRKVGGASHSYHVKGMAADIKVRDRQWSGGYVSPATVFRHIDSRWPECGLGLYKSWVHVDCRPTRARWGLHIKQSASGVSFAPAAAVPSLAPPTWAQGWITSTKWAIARALAEIALRWAWRALRDWRVSPEELLDLASELIAYAKARASEAGVSP